MKSLIPALGLLALFGSTAAHATTYFDTVTWTGPAGSDGPQKDGDTIMADSFTAAAPDFSSVSLSLFDDAPLTDTASIMVYLVPDDGFGHAVGTAGAMDLSGAVLIGSVDPSSLQGSSVGSDPTSVHLTTLTFASSLIPSTSNQEYWIELVASPDSQVEWFANNTAAGTGTAGQQTFNTQFGYFSDTWGAYDLVVTDAPEPTTLALLAAPLLGLGFARARKPAR